MTTLRNALASWVLVIPLVIASIPRGDDPQPPLPWAELERQILPSAAELEFKALGWRTVFWDAVKEAQRTDRPILLWAMNGHPLGCT